MTANGQQPPKDPRMPGVPPAPLSYQFGVDALPGPNGGMVLMQVQSPQGMMFYFLRPDEAKAIGALLEQEATKASTGLSLPPSNGGGLILPPGVGN